MRELTLMKVTDMASDGDKASGHQATVALVFKQTAIMRV